MNQVFIDRLTRSAKLMTRRQLNTRLIEVEQYMRSINPKLGRYSELNAEYKILNDRYREITQPPLIP